PGCFNRHGFSTGLPRSRSPTVNPKKTSNVSSQHNMARHQESPLYTRTTRRAIMAISELLLPELDAEMKKTRTTLERVPADKKEFAPHAKSMPLGKLAPHVAQLAGFGLTILTTPEYDFSTGSIKPSPFESVAQLV